MRQLALLLVGLLLLSGCSLLEEEGAGPADVTAVEIPTAAATPTLQATPPATEAAPGEQPALVLNLWVVSEVSPYGEQGGAIVLNEQLAAFENSHPDLNLSVQVKAPVGQGGTLNYLRTGRNVAPSILPDLIVLPTEHLALAAAEELIYPLDDLLDQEMLADLYPAAGTMAQVDGRFVGYPFALTNLQHTVFSTALLTDTLPATWEKFLGLEEASFVFPASGILGAEMALQLYLDAGGTLAGDINQAALELEPLTTALNQLNRGRREGLIVIQSSNLTAPDEAWQLFINGSANIVQSDAHRYLAEQAGGFSGEYSAVPGIEEPLVPLVKGWAWAVSTPDPTRQALAVELLTWLASAPNSGDWSVQAQYAPARRAAFERWPVDDPYVAFMQAELERAQPYPQISSTLLSALSTAVFDVISLAKSPQAAAEEVNLALQP